MLAFLINTYISYRAFKKAGRPAMAADPWDARSLEWSTASPTPVHNFDYDPIVTERDDWWHKKWGYNEDGKVVRIADPEEIAQDGSNTDVHLPSPSYWPLVLSFSLPVIGYAVIFTHWLLIPAGFLFLASFLGLSLIHI